MDKKDKKKMTQFNIEIITQKPEKIDGLPSYWGRITIGSFSERFVMPIDSWTLEQYKQQWKEGLERIKKYDHSCLVTTVQNLKTNPLIETWNLYKDERNIFFQNSLLIDETVEHRQLKLANFNAQNSYTFIDYPRETIGEDGEEISECSVSTHEFFDSLEKLQYE